MNKVAHFNPFLNDGESSLRVVEQRGQKIELFDLCKNKEEVGEISGATYDRTSSIHLMGGLSAVAESRVSVKKKRKKLKSKG